MANGHNNDDLLARMINRHKAKRLVEQANAEAKARAEEAALPEDVAQEILVGNQDGKVLIAFAQPVEWLGFEPDEAEALVKLVMHHVYAARDAQALRNPTPDAEAGSHLGETSGEDPVPKNIPTVGRRVWYKPHESEKSYSHDQPFDAGIVHVFSDTCVNLDVKNEQGYALTGKTSVTLRQSWAEAAPGEASWMDYHNAPTAAASATDQAQASDTATAT